MSAKNWNRRCTQMHADKVGGQALMARIPTQEVLPGRPTGILEVHFGSFRRLL